MLNYERLAGLHRELKDEPVLTVYLDSDQHDPAQRGVWRTRLDRACSDLRRDLEAADADPAAFLAAVKRLDSVLPADGFLPDEGFAAFVGAETIYYADGVPFPVPNLVLWDQGLHLAPYFRGLKQLRPAFLVVADRRHARLLSYREGALTEAPGLVAFSDVGDVGDSGVAKRAARSSGVRGATAKDLANRFLQVEADRHHAAAVERVTREAGNDGLVLLAGPSETTARLQGLLGRNLEPRTRVVSGISVEDDVTGMLPLVRDAVSDLSRSLQETLLEDVLDKALSDGRGRTGTRDSRKALRESRADLLLVSSSLLESGPELADQLVGAALDQNAEVELLVGAAASRLDEIGEGLAVRLRF
jgi:hypothetical protein